MYSSHEHIDYFCNARKPVAGTPVLTAATLGRSDREHSLLSASCWPAKSAAEGSAMYTSSRRSCSTAAAPANAPLSPALPLRVGSCTGSKDLWLAQDPYC